MKFKPHAWQQAAIDHAVQFLSSAAPGAKQLYAAPTGTGKSVVQLGVQAALGDRCWIVSPREEIIAGLLDKVGNPNGDMLAHRFCTPIRMRNMMLRGELPHPSHLLFDEGHHHNAESWQQLDLLTGLAPSAGYTASPYRGTPRGTQELLERWGEPLWLITYEEAASCGYISVPRFEILPLVDDDIVDVRGGDFDVTSVNAVTVDRLGDMAEHAKRWYNGAWDRPTVFAMPSTEACVRLRGELARRGAPSAVVASGTPAGERELAFRATVERVVALLHINIVSEGVDLPLRRLVDMAPTLSPVKWVQQLGRITRPTDVPPEYIGTNRNILRHAYVLEGVVPLGAVAEASKAFPQAERPSTRVLGLEAIGRFKPDSVKLKSGVLLQVYNLSVLVAGTVVEYVVLVHPAQDPVWASKVNTQKDGVRTWGSWTRCEPPNDLRGFASAPPRPLSEKQRAWWNRSASGFGLDPDQEVTRKNFAVLPILAELGVRFR